MPVSPAVLKKLLLRQKQQIITKRELLLLKLYLATPGAKATLEQIDFSDMPPANDQPGNTQAVRRQQILQAIQTHERMRTARWWYSAAAILLVAGAAVLLRYLVATPESPVAMLRYHTGSGEIKEIVLPDSSRVWLNARSALRYPASFNNGERRIVIEQGEAFFDVKQDKQHPFIVANLQGVETKVLGTSFSVRADSQHVQVAVKTGKVSMEQANRAIVILTPGERADYDMQTATAAVSQSNTANIGAWKTGKIILQQADFATLSTILQQLHGITLVAGQPHIQRLSYSLTIYYNTDPAQLLEVISAVNGNRYTWKDTTHRIAIIQ